MAHERPEAAARRWRITRSEEDEASVLRARLRSGELSLANAELAAFLGHAPALAVVEPPRYINELDLIWGLVEWGRPVSLRAAWTLVKEALPLWNQRPCECWASALFEGEAMGEAFRAAGAALARSEKEPARESRRAHRAAEAALERAQEPVIEAGGCDGCERALDVGEAVVRTAEAAGRVGFDLNDAAAARACAEAILAAGEALGLDRRALIERLRETLVPWALSGDQDLRREPLRARLRLAAFLDRKTYAPDSVLQVEGTDWEYIPLHHFADDAHLADMGLAPEECRAVDAYWRRDQDMCFVELVAHRYRRSPHALGFRARWNGWNPPTLNIHIGIQAEAVTRADFEDALRRWASGPTPENLTDKLTRIEG